MRRSRPPRVWLLLTAVFAAGAWGQVGRGVEETRLTVSKRGDVGTPWVHFGDPFPTGYDVIRGDLAAVGFAEDAVTLGDVICLRDDATAPDTNDYEDFEIPEPGQGFFYLSRSPTAATPGSYGTGSGGLERIAASGDCVLGGP